MRQTIRDWLSLTSFALTGVRLKIKPFSIVDFVFIKSEVRHQTKLDPKYNSPYKITAVLENDRYELKLVNGTIRTYKVTHENLREVPRGLIEVAESYNDDDVTADVSQSNVFHETDRDNDNVAVIGDAEDELSDSDTISVNSSTVSASSSTLSAISDNIESPSSDLPESINVVTQAIVHNDDLN